MTDLETTRLAHCPICRAARPKPWASRDGWSIARCAGCRYAFVNPRPTLAALLRHYRDGARRGVPMPAAAPRRGATPKCRDLVATAVRLMPRPVASGTCLDVGAGHGGTVLAARRAGFAVDAVEPDPSAAALCHSRSGVSPTSSAFEELDLAAESYDLIIVNQVLEHVFDVDLWAHRLAVALRPGGILVISLPSFASLFRRLMGVRDPFITPPEHLNFFSAPSLEQLLHRHRLQPLYRRYCTVIERTTIENRLPRMLWTPASLAAAPLGRLFDALGLGVTLTVYATR